MKQFFLLCCLLVSSPMVALVDPELTQHQIPGWMADINVVLKRQNGTKLFCKGALIAPQWVLSAASCLYDPNRLLDDEQGEPKYIVRLGPNADSVDVEEFFTAPDLGIGLFRIALPSEAVPLPLTSKTAAQLMGSDVTLLSKQRSLPVKHTYYNPNATTPTVAACQVNGREFSIDGAYCYLLTATTSASTLFRTSATVIDPRTAEGFTTALDKLVKLDTSGYLLYLDFRSGSYPCHEDLGSPVLVQNDNGYEIAAVTTGVGMAAGLPICGVSLANRFIAIDGARKFIEQTMTAYDFTASCPKPPKPTVVHTGGNGITLSWTPVKGASGYKVHYTRNHGQLAIESVDVKTLTSIPASIEPGVEYLVAVTAYNSNCSSGLSDRLPVGLAETTR